MTANTVVLAAKPVHKAPFVARDVARKSISNRAHSHEVHQTQNSTGKRTQPHTIPLPNEKHPIS
jgi:hypothetical protein